ncbi:hypothetical protein HAX54_044710 [Datura stramonium]|uniref:Uncharacterized protein n=1 Tax=Datura stramonium TaxID=4076 RepID=A0ABS8SPH9_DATST|nr:hypothetical protein [Datura stramonium]
MYFHREKDKEKRKREIGRFLPGFGLEKMGEGREEENPAALRRYRCLRRREGGEAAQGFGGGFAGNYGGLEGKKERRKRGARVTWWFSKAVRGTTGGCLWLLAGV